MHLRYQLRERGQNKMAENKAYPALLDAVMKFVTLKCEEYLD